MATSTPFFRVRWVLQARRTIHLHPWQHAILYALLCEANRGSGQEAALQIPEGLLLEAPEVARVLIEPGERFAFGATLLENDPDQATRKLHRLCRGLSRVGATEPSKPVTFGGNFDLVDVQDLITGESLREDQPFQPLPGEVLIQEYEQLVPRLGEPITLRFTSPLRLEMPGQEGEDFHRFANERQVHIGQFLRTVQKRLQAIGVVSEAAPELFGDELIELVSNELVWMDVRYGSASQRKTLGGSVGRLRVKLRDPVPLAALVWGQRAHLGRNLNFGFGAYRVEELGLALDDCTRASLPTVPRDPVAALLSYEATVRKHFRLSSAAWRAGLLKGRPLPARVAHRPLSWLDVELVLVRDHQGIIARRAYWLGDDFRTHWPTAIIAPNRAELLKVVPYLMLPELLAWCDSQGCTLHWQEAGFALFR